MTAPLLSVEALTIGVREPKERVLPVVEQASFALTRGGSLGIAGESGSGKSTLLLALMGIVKPGLAHIGGRVLFDGVPMFGAPEERLQLIRGGRLALIPQNAGTALTPTLRIGTQIDEALALHTKLGREQRQERTVELLAKVRLPDPERLARRFPHELSGGQVQRAAIAMALAGEPELLLLDEPTTGLDVTTQLGILDLLSDLRHASEVAFVCVSHDLGVLARLCDRIAVMYAGSTLEEAATVDALEHPAHPYTRALIGSIPRLTGGALPSAIPGRPPVLRNPRAGCLFASRCPSVQTDCRTTVPPLHANAEGRRLACFHPVDSATAGVAVHTQTARGEAAHPDAIALTLDDLSVSYGKPSLFGWLTGANPPNPTVHSVTLSLQRGEILGLVGESGSGKSTILRAISGLWPASGGRIASADGSDLTKPVEQRDGKALRAVQLVFQNPDASLNPRHTIEEILAQPFRLYFRMPDREIRKRAAALLADVRLDESYLARFPGQLSGGERQRVAIARAFAAEPEVLLCDEVTSALDVSVQASVLRLLRDLSSSRGVATILVSHDLAVVHALADRIAVLYLGHVVESGPAREVCGHPRHPYTRALIAAALEPSPLAAKRRAPVRDTNDMPSSGCPFAGRCLDRIEPCLTQMPAWSGTSHRARCHLLEEGQIGACHSAIVQGA